MTEQFMVLYISDESSPFNADDNPASFSSLFTNLTDAATFKEDCELNFYGLSQVYGWNPEKNIFEFLYE